MGFSPLSMFFKTRESKKAKDMQATTPVAYPTGFANLDFVNGQRVKVYDPEDDTVIKEYDSVGLVDGTMTSFIADPGLGKTTFSQQAAVHIVSQFEAGFVIHEDIEKSSHINRVVNITGKKPKWIRNHYVIYQDTHAENIVDRFLDHAKMKINNRKEYEDTTSNLLDTYGAPIKKLVPTVVIIDSLAVMRSENSSILEETKNQDGIDSTTNNMAGARNARFNSEIFKQLLPWCKKANILLFVINQISRKISTGFLPPARDLVGLGENESLSGGRAYLYLSNNVLRFKNKGQLKPDKEYGINGHIISATFYKSRTNASNVEIELIFDKSNGFNELLTLVHFAIGRNIIKKQGNKYIIPGHEDSPFTKKNVCEEVVQNPMMALTLYDLCLPHLQEYLGSADNLNEYDGNDDADNANFGSLDDFLDDDF